MTSASRRPAAVVATIGLALIGVLGFSAPAMAATLTVTNGNDSGAGSLRDAIANSVPGDTIVIPASVTSIVLQSTINIDHGLVITGPGSTVLSITRFDNTVTDMIDFPPATAGQDLTITGLALVGNQTATGSALHVQQGAFAPHNLTLDDVAISGMRNGKGAAVNGVVVQGDVLITNSTFTDDVTSNDGGGAVAFDQTVGGVTLRGDTFTDDVAGTNDGGGVFLSSTGGAILIDGSTFTHNSSNSGNGGGAAFLDNTGTVDVVDSTFDSNSASSDGGGLSVDTLTGAVTVTRTTFTNNTNGSIGSGGGGLGAFDVAGVTITDSTFDRNLAFAGAGALISNSGPVAVDGTSTFSNGFSVIGGGLLLGGVESLAMDGATFTSNTAVGGFGPAAGGGAIAAFGVNNDLGIQNSTFTTNHAAGGAGSGGGALLLGGFSSGAGGVVTLTDNTMTGNTSDDVGGAVLISDAAGGIQLSGGTYTGNTAALGGAFYLATIAADSAFTGANISGNTASGTSGGSPTSGGAGVYFEQIDADVTLSFLRDTFSGNQAEFGGVGVLGDQVDGSLIFGETTFSGNTYTATGSPFGGQSIGLNLLNNGSKFAFQNSTIDETAVGSPTAAILVSTVDAGSQLAISNATIVAPNDLSIFTLDGTGATVTNSILDALAGGAAISVETPGAGATVGVSYSLLSTALPAVATDNGGNQFGVDPALDPLADNGGPTQTRLLQAGSPAINAGDPAFAAPPATDQRGLSRVVGRLDIGAVELQSVTLAATGGTIPWPLVIIAIVFVIAGATLLVVRGRRRRTE